MELLAIFRRTKSGDAALKERTVPLSVPQRFFLSHLDGQKTLGEVQKLSPRHFADVVSLVQDLNRLGLIELVIMPSTQRNVSATQTNATASGLNKTQANRQGVTKTQGVTGTNSGFTTNPGFATSPALKTTWSGLTTNPGLKTDPGLKSTNPGLKTNPGLRPLEPEGLSTAKDALSRLVQHYYGPMAKHTLTKIQGCSSFFELNLLIQQTSQTMIEAFSRSKAQAFFQEAMALLPSDATE